MLPVFTHLPLSTGYVLVSLFSCDPKAEPAITLQFENHRPHISNTRSSAYLLRLQKDSVSPNYGGEFPMLDGLTRGAFQFSYNQNFTSKEQPQLHKACVRTSAVHIVITYKPTIYISSKAVPGSCRYTATLKHEMRHVNTDINTINEFIPRIKALAADAITPARNPRPIEESKVDAAEDDMSEKLSQALQEATDALQKTRASRQRLVDSRKEYERLSKACPNE